MNLNELSEGLGRQAAQVDDIGVASRLGSLHDRIRLARRRRVAGAVGALSLATVAASLVVALMGEKLPRGETPIDDPTPPVVETDDAGFATRVGSMELLDSVIATPVQGRVVLKTDVPTDRVRVAVWCFGVESGKARTETHVTDAEERFPQADEAGRCTLTRPEAFVSDDVASGYASGGGGSAPPPYVTLGTGPEGGSMSLETRLLGDTGLEDAQLAIAVYAVPQPVANVAGVDLYELWYDGRRTRSLLAYGEIAKGSRSVVVQVPSTTAPVLGYFTYRVSGAPLRTLDLLVDGEVSSGTGVSGRVVGGYSPGGGGGGNDELDLELSPGEAHDVELRISGPMPGGVTFAVVFYTDLGRGLR